MTRRLKSWLAVESLEDRCVPAVAEFTAGITPAARPTGITTGPDGNLWFTEVNTSRIGRITPAGVVTEFTLPAGRGPTEIVTGPANLLYFTEADGDRIGRLNPLAGSDAAVQASIVEFAVPGLGSRPTGIAAGSDGNVWFTEIGTDQIGRITPLGMITEFLVPDVGSQPRGIAAGPDGALWFTQAGSDQIGRITTGGTISEFPVPGVGSGLRSITAGPDGALWFTENGSNQIGRITTAGVVTEFALPAGSTPDGIAAGTDALVFAATGRDRIGRITLNGVVTELNAGPITPGSQPMSLLVLGADVWFTEPGTAAIGRLSTVRHLAVGGAGGAAAVFAPTGSGFVTTPGASLSPFAGFGGAVRTAVGDVNGDGAPDTVLVTGPGTPIRVAVISGVDNNTVLVAPFDPFGGNFTGGGYVAAGDLDGDGRAEFVVTPDEGGGPRVSVFSRNAGGTADVRANFLGIDDSNFRGGARAAVGDVNADGTPDVVVSAGFGGGPRTAVFGGPSVLAGSPARLVNDFFAFPGTDATNLRNGSFVAAGDVTGDGFADLIFGGGPGGAPRVFILSGALVSAGDVAGAQAAPVANFFVAGNAADRGGVRVAATDADGNARADVAVGSGAGSPAKVRVYLGANFAGSAEPGTFQDITVFGGAALPGGVFVG